MEIRNNAEALQAFLGISSTATAKTTQIRGDEGAAAQVAFAGDQATLSNAGAEVLQSVSDASVRADKVRAIQQALAAGTYSVEASAVADKVIDAMLIGGFSPGNR